MATRVSVIIPTKNRASLLEEALASVRALEGPDLDLEIIVADNGSTDRTESVARAFKARFVQTLTPGAAAARNAGMLAATGEYLAFLDDDDVWLPGHLRPHLDLLGAHPDMGAVVGQVRNCDFTLATRSAPWPGALPPGGDCLTSFFALCPQIGATVARASVLASVGYQDESLLSDEDWDWHLRLAIRHRIGFVAIPCVLFRTRLPGTRGDLHWMRLGFNRRVFWTNVWRAGRRRPQAREIARLYLRHNGAFAAHFLESAILHGATSDRATARRELVRAIYASPLHAALAILREAKVRRTLCFVALPQLRPRAAGPGIAERLPLMRSRR